jgi:glucose/arabinose dehydrogenase
MTGLGRFLGVLCVLVLTMPAQADYRLLTLAEGFDHPWCLAFLPGGDMLVTERSGQLLRLSANGAERQEINGVPEVFFHGQGGLFDVIPDPAFSRNRRIYLSLASGNGRANATRVVSALLADNRLNGLEILFTAQPAKNTPHHYGGHMAFLADGSLLLTTGDGFDFREQAQALDSLLGKTVRINTDGSPAVGNPFAQGNDAGQAIWTYGHRNPQGLVVDVDTQRVFLHEHGPRGGDEINILEAGGNYGWPAATYGVDYNGARVSPYTELPDMVAPIKHWVPSIAPSGMALYRGDVFPEWEGDLFVGALVDREVRRIDLEGDRVVAEEALFAELGERIRDIRLGPEGLLYLLTDGPQGKLVRVER